MSKCTGDVCWKEKIYFREKHIRDIQAIATDTPPGPKLDGEFKKIMTGSKEWKEKIKIETVDPRPEEDKQKTKKAPIDFNRAIFEKKCEPESEVIKKYSFYQFRYDLI